jgi:hypothetical protein
MDNFNVSELIGAIKKEILTAENNAVNERRIFQLNEMELDLKFVVGKDDSKNAQVKLSVLPFSLGAGGKTDHRKEEVQNIKLKFKVLQLADDDNECPANNIRHAEMLTGNPAEDGGGRNPRGIRTRDGVDTLEKKDRGNPINNDPLTNR